MNQYNQALAARPPPDEEASGPAHGDTVSTSQSLLQPIGLAAGTR